MVTIYLTHSGSSSPATLTTLISHALEPQRGGLPGVGESFFFMRLRFGLNPASERAHTLLTAVSRCAQISATNLSISSSIAASIAITASACRPLMACNGMISVRNVAHAFYISPKSDFLSSNPQPTPWCASNSSNSSEHTRNFSAAERQSQRKCTF